MEQNKEQVVNELYALRAGLSAISQGKDRIDQCGKRAEEQLIRYCRGFYEERGFPEKGISWGLLNYKKDEDYHETYARQAKEGLVAIWEGKGVHFSERGYDITYGILDHNLCNNLDDYYKRREEARERGDDNYNGAEDVVRGCKKRRCTRGIWLAVFTVLAVICAVFLAPTYSSYLSTPPTAETLSCH